MTRPKTVLMQLPTTAQKKNKKQRPQAVIVVSVAILVLAAAMVLFGNLLFPNATSQDILNGRLPAGSPNHPFGTDPLGRDLLALTVAGAASALIGPLAIALGSMAFGVVFGTISGYFRGWIDFALNRWVDLLLALPVILVAIVITGILGSTYWVTVAVLILLFSPSDIRIVRAAVLEQLPRPYIESAKMLQLSTWRILFRHIFPNISTIVVANLLLNFAFAIVAMSSLSFLGIGVGPDAADWGRQLSDGQAIMMDNPVAVIAPALLIIAVACAVNLIGDAMTSAEETDTL
jgi:peptide/nickel transport system permease protein